MLIRYCCPLKSLTVLRIIAKINKQTWFSKKCLFSIYAGMIWCPTWSKSFGRYLMNVYLEMYVLYILVRYIAYIQIGKDHVFRFIFGLCIFAYSSVQNNHGGTLTYSYFSVCITLWLFLSPSRFMSSIWALFAVVFLALYTANLAAFMIPRKEYHNLVGLDDHRVRFFFSNQ